jgi:hypothetical protein
MGRNDTTRGLTRESERARKKNDNTREGKKNR